MASYSINTSIDYYLGSWGTYSLGSTSTGGPIASASNSSYRTILGITITPSSSEIVTSLSLKIGYTSSSSTATKLGGYLYTNLSTAKSSVSGPPSGYIANAIESSGKAPTASGRMTTLKWTGLNISANTTVYVWFYLDQNVYSQIWTGSTGNIVAPTVSGTVTSKGYIYVDNGSSFDKYEVYIDNGSSWDRYIPYIDNGSSWDLYG